MTANSSCELAEQRAALGADADHAEVHAFDLNHLVERIEVGRRTADRRSASRSRRPGALLSTSVGLIRRPRSASKLEKSTYSPVTPWMRVWSIDLSRYVMRPPRGHVGHHRRRPARCTGESRARRPS